jgi:hypothetical protein
VPVVLEVTYLIYGAIHHLWDNTPVLEGAQLRGVHRAILEQVGKLVFKFFYISVNGDICALSALIVLVLLSLLG